MARKKPQSAKQHKLQLQAKRAYKRGEAPPPNALASIGASNNESKKLTHKPRFATTGDKESDPSSKRLASRFLALTPEYIAQSRTTALSLPLPRPLPPTASNFPVHLIDQATPKKNLSIPRRPKWRYEMSKKEVEANEEGQFRKWLKGVDESVEEWREEGKVAEAEREAGREEREKEGIDEPEREIWPRSTVFFERNLQVWRQLWRTTEMASILLVLIDIRCPPLHLPPSLIEYVLSFQPRKEVILVLTKCDLVPKDVKDGWESWCKREWGDKYGWDIVAVESYKREARKQGTRSVLKSHLPASELSALITALQNAHQRLLTPPPSIAENPERLKKWRPRVRTDVDWDGLRRGEAKEISRELKEQMEKKEEEEGLLPVGVKEDEVAEEGERELVEPDEFLTVGLIGQPNVGKSSLLNALVGASKVRASKTPGKTKHFQTIFWSSTLRLADTPGLVIPSLTPYELQSISSILPISHIPALPAVLRLAASLMPLEKVLGLKLEVDKEEREREGKKTYRKGMEPVGREGGGAREEVWTTADIMEGWALERGFLTAKAGRPDSNRSGNHILRAIAEGRIPWAFTPPPSSSLSPVEGAPTSAQPAMRQGQGIWLGERVQLVYESSDGEEVEESSDYESSSEEEDESSAEGEEGKEGRSGSDGEGGEEEEGSGDEEEEEEYVAGSKKVGGMFGGLEIEDGEDESSEEEEEEGEDFWTSKEATT